MDTTSPNGIHRSRSMDDNMVRLVENREETQGNLYEMETKNIFQGKRNGVSWYSLSTDPHKGARYSNGETQPLLNAKNRNYSFNGIQKGKMRDGSPHFPRSSFKRLLHPLRNDMIYKLYPSDPVTISDVCKTATPLLSSITELEGGISSVRAILLLINAALGIGILNFPEAYDIAGGLFFATVIQLLMVVIIILTMLILAHCSDIHQDVTYHDVLLSMCGPTAQKVAAVSITCTCYGVCVAVLIIIGDQLDTIFMAAFGETFCHQWYLNRNFTIPAVSFALVLPMCYFKTLDWLGYFGTFGIIAMLYPVFLTVYGYFNLPKQDVDIKTHPDKLSGLFVVVPVLCFAYQCQEVVVPVYAGMKQRTLGNFAKCCCISMGFLVVLYSIIGCFGYLTFGSSVLPNVMKMYDAKDKVIMIGIGALIVKMVVIYPVMALCGKGAVDGLYGELTRLPADQFASGEKKRRFLIITFWFISTLIIAVYTSSIGTVIHALGAVSSANIFIYPGLCLMSVVLQSDPDVQKWKSIFLIAGAIILAAMGCFFSGIILTDTFLNKSNSANVLLCF